MKKHKNKFKYKIENINQIIDTKESFLTTFKLIISALTLVSALAWNEAIKGIFELLKQNDILKSAGFAAPFIYAILVTIFTVFIINRLQGIEKNLTLKNDKKLKEMMDKEKDNTKFF
jgi:p-aminobenzoyl-glutamate transporter AbgT